MNITVTELKKNLSKYLKLAAYENIYVTNRGKKVAMLTNPNIDKHKVLDSLIGIIPGDTSLEHIKDERLKRQ